MFQQSEDKAMASANQSKRIISVSKKVIWEIRNCSTRFFTEYENGRFIDSDPFCVCSDNMVTKWQLTLFPNGTKEESKSYISLFLDFDEQESSELVDFDVKYTMVAVNSEIEKSQTGGEGQFSRNNELEESGYGTHKLLSHLELNDGFINDRKLKIVAQITVEFKVETNKPGPSSVKIEPKKSKGFKNMFENNAWTDFEIITNDGEVLKAHKIVLANHSPMFFAMLTIDMSESKAGSCNVPDFNSKIMKEVLRFIYYEEVENLNDLAPELIFAAEKYQLKGLKTACLKSLILALPQVVNRRVVIEFLKIADLVSGADELFEKCLDLIVSDFPNATKTPEWKELSLPLVSKIAEKMIERCNTLNLSKIVK